MLNLPVKRENKSLTAGGERILTSWLVRLIPSYISPDHMTLLAFAGAILACISLINAGSDVDFLHLANLGIFIHWMGDSLDGLLARWRKRERPNYGYYVDHLLDAVSLVFILGGLVTSSLTVSNAWGWVLVVFLLLMVHIFLATKITGVFELSFGFFGPTEARLGLIVSNLLIYFCGNPIYLLVGTPFTLFDLIGVGVALILGMILIFVSLVTMRRLHLSDLARFK